MIPLTDLQIDEKMSDTPGYLGCFMRDEIPTTLRKGYGFILNLDVSSGNGTHWTCIMRVSPSPDKKVAYCYYDSFGMPPPQEIIRQYGGTYYNSTAHQPIFSASCGWYAMYVLEEVLGNKRPFIDVIYDLSPGSSNGSSDSSTPLGIGDSDNDLLVIDSIRDNKV